MATVADGKRLIAGDQCPDCPGTIGVVKTEVRGAMRHRHLACRECGYQPSPPKQIVPIEFAPARKPRGK